MSRCRACNTKLFVKDTVVVNPLTHQEEDLCNICRGESKNPKEIHDYVGGNNPQSGATDACEFQNGDND